MDDLPDEYPRRERRHPTGLEKYRNVLWVFVIVEILQSGASLHVESRTADEIKVIEYAASICERAYYKAKKLEEQRPRYRDDDTPHTE